MLRKCIYALLVVLLSLTPTVDTLARDVLLDGGLSISSEVTLDGEPIGINALRIEDNSNLLFNFYFMNSETNQRNVRVIFAIYNGNSRLRGIETIDGIAYQNNELNLSLTIACRAK